MNSVWLVVADSSKARIFTMESRKGPINEIKSIAHTEARMHEREMTSDSPGRSSGKGGAGQHNYQDEVSPMEQENINFARQLANELDDERKKNTFNQLILVAPPEFLGKLRQQLSAQTHKLVCLELAKNLSAMNPVDIRKHLPERFPSLQNTAA